MTSIRKREILMEFDSIRCGKIIKRNGLISISMISKENGSVIETRIRTER